MLIPKQLHRIWFGPNPIPPLYEMFWRRWKRLHPTWRFQTWTYDNLPPLINQQAFDDCDVAWPAKSHTHNGVKQEVMRADIASYDLLTQYGGVYINCDMEPIQPIDPLLDGVEAFAAWERRGFIGNAIMGSTPNHPFMQACVKLIPGRVTRGWDMERATGPYLPTHIHKHHQTGLTVFSAKTLYNGEYATHHWGHQLETT